MAIVEVNLPHHHYDVTIEPGALERLGRITADAAPHARCALIGDAQVMDIYGQTTTDALAGGGYTVIPHAMPTGEAHKNLDTVRAA